MGRRVRISAAVIASSVLAGTTVFAASAAVGATSASSGLRYAADGRAKSLVVTGSVGHADGLRLVKLVLQTRPAAQPSSWVTRATKQLHLGPGRTPFRISTSAPAQPATVALRVLLMSGHSVLRRGTTVLVAAGDPAAVFYSGEGSAGAGDISEHVIRLVASSSVPSAYDGRWTSPTQCDPRNAVPKYSAIDGEPITELAGYSLGRLGPIYFLDDSPSWMSQITYILLLDPGPEGQMVCEPKLNVAPWQLLAGWLSQNSDHRLVIMDGPATSADAAAGVFKYYLDGMTAAQLAQVSLCETGSPDHHTHYLVDAIGGWGWMVGAPPPAGQCPAKSTPIPIGAPITQPAPTTATTTTTSTPPPSGTVTLAQGPAAPAGYWYAITLSGFAPSTGVPVTCADAADPQGFRTFTLTTDATGEAATSDECYSGVSGNHWVTADGVGSNQVDWGAATSPPPTAVDAYDNYGPANAGQAMCRGNPGNSQSMPGGTVTQTFTVPSGAASIDAAKVQIDPDATVTAHLTVFVNGAAVASDNEAASGDTNFSFGSVPVAAGDQVTLRITFTATYGKIITVYTAGAPGGTFSTSNSCPADAPSVTETNTGLRAVVSGLSG